MQDVYDLAVEVWAYVKTMSERSDSACAVPGPGQAAGRIRSEAKW
jgi:hypothetical protein